MLLIPEFPQSDKRADLFSRHLPKWYPTQKKFQFCSNNKSIGAFIDFDDNGRSTPMSPLEFPLKLWLSKPLKMFQKQQAGLATVTPKPLL